MMKTAIVTGGTQGIGREICCLLLMKGYKVYTTFAHNAETAKDAASIFACISKDFEIRQVDQSIKGSIHSFAEYILSKESAIDCIVCNAGTTLRKSAFEITDDEWESVMLTNVNSHFYLIRDLYHAIPNDSRIVFIGSMLAVYPHGTSLPYGVTKSAIHALALNLVKEFEGTGTTINVIAPGFIDTPWQKNKPAEIRENICRKTALHRFGTPDEVANTVDFIISNPFVNGSVIELSGGYCFK